MSQTASVSTRGTSRVHLRSRKRALNLAKSCIGQHWNWDGDISLDSDVSDVSPASPCISTAGDWSSGDDTDVASDVLSVYHRRASAKNHRRDVEMMSHKLARLGIHAGDVSDAESSSSTGTLVEKLISSMSAARLDPSVTLCRAHCPALSLSSNDDSDTEESSSSSSYGSARGVRSPRRPTAREILRKAAFPHHSLPAVPAVPRSRARRATAPYPVPATSLSGAFVYSAATSHAFTCGAWNGDLLVAPICEQGTVADADWEMEDASMRMADLSLHKTSMRFDRLNGTWFPFTFNHGNPY
ncbi:hypothetical protein OBBRIDRAFT_526450 [Obba rivulosa]|uniref:Uncharacterized protein n=1 Tax=Obba rivulosa TaxID=1052685 RepID=A0A8E2DKD7_9APHY|nr:hypothetical protein OBBRIDRAFT_526450 [Obba rivulosa]